MEVVGEQLRNGLYRWCRLKVILLNPKKLEVIVPCDLDSFLALCSDDLLRKATLEQDAKKRRPKFLQVRKMRQPRSPTRICLGCFRSTYSFCASLKSYFSRCTVVTDRGDRAEGAGVRPRREVERNRGVSEQESKGPVDVHLEAARAADVLAYGRGAHDFPRDGRVEEEPCWKGAMGHRGWAQRRPDSSLWSDRSHVFIGEQTVRIIELTLLHPFYVLWTTLANTSSWCGLGAWVPRLRAQVAESCLHNNIAPTIYNLRIHLSRHGFFLSPSNSSPSTRFALLYTLQALFLHVLIPSFPLVQVLLHHLREHQADDVALSVLGESACEALRLAHRK